MKKEGLRLEQISDAIRGYKLGIVENPWSKVSKEKINNGIEILENRVKGQRQAVVKALDVIKRAYIGLSGAQHSKSLGKPKGVLFFAGPTGVGKTELAKAITELIFGSEQNYIRFDMSEFNHEHSDQRLIGAPPGYVGYEAGGELTNAVKQNPFSVILFDEIEKAHPKILDKFLQILEDGRLTDGRGETVYFSETLIIFTSNLGVYATDEFGNKIPLVLPNEPYEIVRERILKSIEDFFKFQIGRPEILNRIGENIIVFDFIRPEFANQIFDKMLNNIISKLWEDKKITLKLDDSAYENLREECTKDLSMGGRGIGNKLEEIFVNPLSREIFERDVKEGDIFLIHDIILENNIWKVTGEIKNNSFGG
jgi:ATP-dependent Clp protease ATP-binding subunit ClpA